MDIKRYWRSLSSKEKQALADKVGVTKAFLSNAINGHQRVSAAMAIKIDVASNKKITKKSLRPDIFEGK